MQSKLQNPVRLLWDLLVEKSLLRPNQIIRFSNNCSFDRVYNILLNT